MSGPEHLYPLWRKDAIAAARQKMRAAEKAFDSLQNKSNIYARSIAALAAMHRQALAVYENSPETLDPQGAAA
ncbi:MAG: hypothetical protein JWP27_3044 [Flaviaesturariibacter sp.]|nr:hypothetical protein [Flaviaesturariibacter sp.]